MPAAKPQRFSATLVTDSWSLGWTVAPVPFQPATVWPKMVRLRVRGTVNGIPFRTSLFTSADGGSFLLVNREAQKAGKVRLGDAADFVLEPDMEDRVAELPDELAMLLEEDPGLRDWYDALSEYWRREIGKWVTGVKSAEARLRRSQQMAERLLATKEGELELPPILQAAFRRRPKARAGWDAMTLMQRRAELMAVFSYQGVEARQRRVEKLCGAAEKKAPIGGTGISSTELDETTTD